MIYGDEVMFTSATNQSRTWAKFNTPLTIEHQKTTTRPIAVVAMISAGKGVELVEQFSDSVDKYKFEVCLDKIRERNPNRKICLFLDNLPVHKAKVVTEKAAKLQIPFIFNCPYYPEGNPIELVFSMVKREYKKSKLRCIVENKKIYHKVLINNAFKKVTKRNVQ